MPPQSLHRRPVPHPLRQPDGRPVQRVVIPSVLELLLDAAADFEAVLGRDRDVPRIEQLVDVGPEEDAVIPGVNLDVVKLADVRRFERRECALAGHGAPAPVTIEDGDPEAALPEARPDHGWSTESRSHRRVAGRSGDPGAGQR